MNLQDSSTGGTKLVGARNELRCCCKKSDWQDVEGIYRCCCVMGAPVYGNGVLGDQTKHIVQTRECPRVPRCDKFPQMVGTRSGIANAKVGKPGWCALRVGDPMITQGRGEAPKFCSTIDFVLYDTDK